MSYNNGLLKARNNANKIILQPTTCDLSHHKNCILTFSATLLKLCSRGGMKSSKVSQGRNASEKLGNHCTRRASVFA